MDWAYSVAGIDYTYLMELRPRRWFEIPTNGSKEWNVTNVFHLPEDQIIETGEEAWAFHLAVAREMIKVQEGVIEVERWDVVGHIGIVGRGRVSVAQDDVMQPVGNNTGGVHQVPDRLQHRLEVVLLRLPPHQNVE